MRLLDKVPSKAKMIEYLDGQASEDYQDYFYSSYGLLFREHLQTCDFDSVKNLYRNELITNGHCDL
jgi:hypothetical protein